jgi:hypothetical protein
LDEAESILEIRFKSVWLEILELFESQLKSISSAAVVDSVKISA